MLNNSDSTYNAVEDMLLQLGVDLNDPNFTETPRRLVSYLTEHFPPQNKIDAVIADCQRAVFPNKYTGMVVSRNIEVNGMCPHHLLPVIYNVHIGYIPDEKAIGLSKLNRLAEIFGCQAVMQEDFTFTLANKLSEILKTDNVAVVVKGEHFCMKVRGVKAHNPYVMTSELRGGFMAEPEVRQEFYKLIELNHS